MSKTNVIKKLSTLLKQAQEAGYIKNEEREMMLEFAVRGSGQTVLRDKGSLEGNP